jgi:hypothetical protein
MRPLDNNNAGACPIVRGIGRTALTTYSLRARQSERSPKRITLDKHLYEEAAVKGILRWCLARSQILPISELLRCVSLSYRFVPIQGEPFACRAALTAPTYIRPGSTPVHNPSCALRGRGLQGGMGPFSSAASFSPCLVTVHTSTLDLIIFSYRSSVLVPHPLRAAPCPTLHVDIQVRAPRGQRQWFNLT